jgi:hypothetical protein
MFEEGFENLEETENETPEEPTEKEDSELSEDDKSYIENEFTDDEDEN